MSELRASDGSLPHPAHRLRTSPHVGLNYGDCPHGYRHLLRLRLERDCFRVQLVPDSLLLRRQGFLFEGQSPSERELALRVGWWRSVALSRCRCTLCLCR